MAWLKNGLNTSDVITNTDVDNWDDGIYDLYQGNALYVVTTGTANTYVATFTTPYLTYTTGMTTRVKFNVENTGSSTINYDTLGAKTIKKVTGAGIEVLEAGDIIADGVYVLVYNGTDMIIAGQMRVKPMIQVFTVSGTFTAPQTGKYKVTVVGGGGSGANCSGSTHATGGGGGGCAIKVVSLTKSQNTTVTIGAGGAGQASGGNNGNVGGTSSFGAFCSATGGAGGNFVNNDIAYGAIGGIGSNGDINLRGGQSAFCNRPIGGVSLSNGGESFVSGSYDSTSYGTGSQGSGGASNAGASGIVIVEWMEG